MTMRLWSKGVNWLRYRIAGTTGRRSRSKMVREVAIRRHGIWLPAGKAGINEKKAIALMVASHDERASCSIRWRLVQVKPDFSGVTARG